MHEKIEKEAKFYVRDLKKMEHLIKDFGGRVVQPRIFESNLRFDTHERKLSTSHQVLRLRQDTRARLTYKEPADPNSEVSARLEYEVEIDNLTTARHILEVLGFEVITIYEKYRASYFLDEVEISLDEMPFGKFMEIEGADTQHIQKMADKLNLVWENRSPLSYMRIFSLVKERLGLSMRDLTFDNFSGLDIQPSHLQLSYAD
ncbi:MAG: class IV adenylate cyclase [Anaerolineaceae bacterium]|nr:class IV adenylate cyclase [Anaerolineaceae bacterium]